MALKDIDTIIVVMLENRSFDHMLGYLSLPDAPGGPMEVDGLQADPAWLARYANHAAHQVHLPERIKPEAVELADPHHSYDQVARQLRSEDEEAGPITMRGFAANYADVGPPSLPMGYYGAEDVPVFDFFARHFAVCDRWFAALPAATQPNRLMAMSGESRLADNRKRPLPKQTLVYDWLNGGPDGAPKIDWCVYQSGLFPFFFAMLEWTGKILASLAVSEHGNFRRMKHFAAQWASNKPMPSVVFLEPRYREGPGKRANDDHPPSAPAAGQAFLAKIYQALIANPDRWARTLMLITYDEHGGFFDHVTPLGIPAKAGDVTFATTGVRVPAFVVSPHVAPGQPFHGQVDHTSILQLIADRFRPGKGYSPDVTGRHGPGKLAGLAGALGPAPAGAPYAPPLPAGLLDTLRARVHAKPVAQMTGASPHDPPTAQAQALSVRLAERNHPVLMAGAWHADDEDDPIALA